MSMDEKLQAVKDDILAFGTLSAKTKGDVAALHAEIDAEIGKTGAQVASDTKAADVKPTA